MLVAACSQIGPKLLPPDREGFNSSLQMSDKEQLLLNIVRLRYDDTPYFLGVDSIASGFTFDKSITGTAAFTNQTLVGSAGNIASISVTPTVSFEERPTISYVPLQGQKFTEQLLTPISLGQIYLLGTSSWSIARLLRVTVQAVGNLTNATGSTRPDTSHVPEYKPFVTFAHLLREYQRKGLVDILGIKTNDHFNMGISIKAPTSSAEIQKLYSLLAVKGQPTLITLAQEQLAEGPRNNPNSYHVTTRSLLGMLYYLSKGVDISNCDIESHVVVVPSYPSGELFDWRDVTKGMFRVHSACGCRPKCAFVAVYYRCRWFYIADNDSNSKQTFALLQQIFALLVSEVKGKAPILTIPV
jgi:hypothetical protein